MADQYEWRRYLAFVVGQGRGHSCGGHFSAHAVLDSPARGMVGGRRRRSNSTRAVSGAASWLRFAPSDRQPRLMGWSQINLPACKINHALTSATQGGQWVT